MNKNTTFDILNPAKNIVKDQLTEFIRTSAVNLLQAAVEAEVAELLEQVKDHKTNDGKQRVVRNGYLPTREIQTGMGSIGG